MLRPASFPKNFDNERTGQYPAVLAMHGHAGCKYFGKEKLTDGGDANPDHPMVTEYKEKFFGGRSWASELAKKGFIVLVADSFAFGSRKFSHEDVQNCIKPEHRDAVKAAHEARHGTAASGFGSGKLRVVHEYEAFAAQHEETLARSLCAAGMSWASITLGEDIVGPSAPSPVARLIPSFLVQAVLARPCPGLFRVPQVPTSLWAVQCHTRRAF